MRSEPTRLDTGEYLLGGGVSRTARQVSDRMGLFTGDGVDALAMYSVVL